MRLYLSIILLASWVMSPGQSSLFTHQDTLRGSITPERSWWNLDYYDLSIKVDPS